MHLELCEIEQSFIHALSIENWGISQRKLRRTNIQLSWFYVRLGETWNHSAILKRKTMNSEWKKYEYKANKDFRILRATKLQLWSSIAKRAFICSWLHRKPKQNRIKSNGICQHSFVLVDLRKTMRKGTRTQLNSVKWMKLRLFSPLHLFLL